MATQTLPTDIPLAKPSVSSSPIAVMHTRYEAVMAVSSVVDSASLNLGKSDDEQQLGFGYAKAITTCEAETDALRTAILFQIPTSWHDALILQYHVYVAHDLYTPGREPENERAALGVAIATIFDFMARMVEADQDALGRCFKASTMLVSDRRRFRTAELKD